VQRSTYEVGRVSIEDVGVLFGDVDVVKQVVVHERPVGLRVLARDALRRGRTVSEALPLLPDRPHKPTKALQEAGPRRGTNIFVHVEGDHMLE